MAVNCLKWLEMAIMDRNSQKCLEMARKGCEWLIKAGMVGYGWKCMELAKMAKNDYEWLKIAVNLTELLEIFLNGWKYFEMSENSKNC